MIKVQIAQLKNGLSSYLKRVQEGAEVLVTDREKPIARIIPISMTEIPTLEELLLKLQGENVITLNFSAKTRQKRLNRVKLTPGPLASEIVIRDRD